MTAIPRPAVILSAFATLVLLGLHSRPAEARDTRYLRVHHAPSDSRGVVVARISVVFANPEGTVSRVFAGDESSGPGNYVRYMVQAVGEKAPYNIDFWPRAFCAGAGSSSPSCYWGKPEDRSRKGRKAFGPLLAAAHRRGYVVAEFAPGEYDLVGPVIWGAEITATGEERHELPIAHPWGRFTVKAGEVTYLGDIELRIVAPWVEEGISDDDLEDLAFVPPDLFGHTIDTSDHPCDAEDTDRKTDRKTDLRVCIEVTDAWDRVLSEADPVWWNLDLTQATVSRQFPGGE